MLVFFFCNVDGFLQMMYQNIESFLLDLNIGYISTLLTFDIEIMKEKKTENKEKMKCF